MMSLSIGVFGFTRTALVAVQSAERTSDERRSPVGPKYDMIDNTCES